MELKTTFLATIKEQTRMGQDFQAENNDKLQYKQGLFAFYEIVIW